MKRLIFITFLFVLTACSVDPEIKPTRPTNDIKEIIPEGWPEPFYNFANNTLSNNKFVLGRALFYEPMFSRDNSISCGSCHQQFAAFSQGGHSVSHGINGLLGTRNSPALQNLLWNPTFFYDGGVTNLELFPPAPITNVVEMGETLQNVVSKIGSSQKYKKLFLDAYGSDTVTTQRMFKSIAQFIGTMYSYNSKYDKVKQGKETFSAAEQSGYTIFIQKCAACHKEPLFSDFNYRSNGLPINAAINDIGRAHITANTSDMYKFKTPSLRNIEVSGPYMHDGRFVSLTECLNHYTNGVMPSNALDPILTNGISINAQEKNDLLAFLKTLTDHQFLTDKKFSDPN